MRVKTYSPRKFQHEDALLQGVVWPRKYLGAPPGAEHRRPPEARCLQDIGARSQKEASEREIGSSVEQVSLTVQDGAHQQPNVFAEQQEVYDSAEQNRIPNSLRLFQWVVEAIESWSMGQLLLHVGMAP